MIDPCINCKDAEPECANTSHRLKCVPYNEYHKQEMEKFVKNKKEVAKEYKGEKVKAKLVFDMPESCRECPLKTWNRFGFAAVNNHCVITKVDITYFYDRRHPKCQLGIEDELEKLCPSCNSKLTPSEEG
jgi:aldehyde:ferredoxin oxidoreductase